MLDYDNIPAAICQRFCNILPRLALAGRGGCVVVKEGEGKVLAGFCGRGAD